MCVRFFSEFEDVYRSSLAYGWAQAHRYFAIMGGCRFLKKTDRVILSDQKNLDLLRDGKISITGDKRRGDP